MIATLRTRARADDRGSIAIELAILAPIVGILLLAVVAVGRVQNSRADVEGAARSAARDLSIARDPGEAIGRARTAASVTLDVGSPGCRTFSFVAVIEADKVTVTVSCVANLEDAAILPLPGSMTLEASATEVLDKYREKALGFSLSDGGLSGNSTGGGG
jgi:Flp pilus assembly protein TadG